MRDFKNTTNFSQKWQISTPSTVSFHAVRKYLQLSGTYAGRYEYSYEYNSSPILIISRIFHMGKYSVE
jgi:hypothetical protein